MDAPPPIPQASRPAIKRAVFTEKRAMRLGHVTFDYSLVEKSHEQAEAWMNQHPQVELVQIQTFETPMIAVTVVWHR